MIYIFGAGGGFKELYESRDHLIFWDNYYPGNITLIAEDVEAGFINDIPIINLDNFDPRELDHNRDYAFISASDVHFKERIAEVYPELNWITFIHTKSDFLLPMDKRGKGNWFGYGTHIPSDLKIGSHVRVNYGAVFGHDCKIGDYSFVGINSSICATTNIGKGVCIGSGAVIINKNLKIGDWSTVGAGSVVTKDIEDNVVAYGNPCKVVRENK